MTNYLVTVSANNQVANVTVLADSTQNAIAAATKLCQDAYGVKVLCHFATVA